MNRAFLCFFLVTIYEFSTAVDYCGLKNKDTCLNHIGCDQEETSIESSTLELSFGDKFAILTMFNTLKNDIALGKISGFSPASNIGSVGWDDELEQLVDVIAKRYPFETHDECVDTEHRKNNLNDFHPESEEGESPSIIIRDVNSFLNSIDYKNSLQEIEVETYAHLTHVACRYVKYQDPELQSGVRCLYHFGNEYFPDFEPYVEGKPCSDCQKCHPIYTGLCAV